MVLLLGVVGEQRGKDVKEEKEEQEKAKRCKEDLCRLVLFCFYFIFLLFFSCPLVQLPAGSPSLI